jgi:hypothetical protein
VAARRRGGGRGEQAGEQQCGEDQTRSGRHAAGR